jgi:hypothetical protein
MIEDATNETKSGIGEELRIQMQMKRYSKSTIKQRA